MLSNDLKSVQLIAKFFRTSLELVETEIQRYFEPCEMMIIQTAGFTKGASNILDKTSPLRNILNKSYQSNYKKITKKCFTKSKL